MNLIEQLKRRLGQAVEPIARAAVRLGIGPNAITTTGLAVMLAAATAFGGGAVRWGGALLVVGSLFNVLGNRRSAFGALYDSTLDRVGESAVWAGIALFFLRDGVPPERETVAVMAAIGALAASLVASYTSARAGALGLEAGGGSRAPAARIILIGLPALLFGPGPNGSLLFWMLALFALVAAATAAHRVVYVARSAGHSTSPAGRRDTLPGRATVLNRNKP